MRALRTALIVVLVAGTGVAGSVIVGRIVGMNGKDLSTGHGAPLLAGVKANIQCWPKILLNAKKLLLCTRLFGIHCLKLVMTFLRSGILMME